jgi:hypothetical protein
VSEPVGKHLDEAFASVDDVPVRELVATSEALERRKESASRADEKLAAQIADAPAPFWRHVRDALAERHP